MADGALDDMGGGAQGVVAGGVSERVVEGLERIEVAEQQRQRRVELFAAAQFLAQTLVEVAVVVKACQPVGDGVDLGAVGVRHRRLQDRGQRLLAGRLRAALLGAREGRQAGGHDCHHVAAAVANGRDARDPHAELVGKQGVDPWPLSGKHLGQHLKHFVGGDVGAERRVLRGVFLGVHDQREAPLEPGLGGESHRRRVGVAHLAQERGDLGVVAAGFVSRLTQAEVLVGVDARRRLLGNLVGPQAARLEVVEYLEKDVGDRGVELQTAAAPQLLETGVGVERLAVGPLERHRVVGVDHAQRSRREGDLLAAQTVGVTGAVPALVVVTHAEDQVLLEQRADDVGAEHRMLAHQVPLLGVQHAGLEQDAVGDADLADVVEIGGLFGAAYALFGPAQSRAQQHHVGRHARRVAEGVDVLGVQSRAQRLEVTQVHRLDVRVEAGVLDREGELRAHAFEQSSVE